MKNLYLLFAASLISFCAQAQLGYNYKEFGIGYSYSYERAYTSIPSEYYHGANAIDFIYNNSPFIPIEAEIQFGKLSGGGLLPSQDPLGRQYTNNYESLGIHVDFQLGEIINYQDNEVLAIIKNVYFGSGLNLIFNSNTVQRTSIYQPTYTFPGRDNSIDFTVPFRFGYDIKLFNRYQEPMCAIHLGYVYNIVLGNGLNGYDYPPSQNYRSDGYGQFVVGVRLFFGNIVGYSKLIRGQSGAKKLN